MSATVDKHSLPLRCWAEIDCDALRHNVAVCRELAGTNCEVMAIVKADAYGHGLETVGRILEPELNWFGVANLAEGLRLRNVFKKEANILILSPATPDERPLLVENRLAVSVSDADEIESYRAVAEELKTKARLHLVADTGMGRMGAPPETISGLIQQISASEWLEFEGLASHFPSADENREFTVAQIERFLDLSGTSASPPHLHIANSAGLIRFQNGLKPTTLARPGLAIYGISPVPESGAKLKPALSLKTRITLIRDLPKGTSISYGSTYFTDRPMKVATLGVGYGDGYPRSVSGNGGEVLIGGQRCPILGRVTMDQIVVDLSASPQAEVGDSVTLIGHDQDEVITASEVAEKAGTIPWEILTSMSSRVKRVYLNE